MSAFLVSDKHITEMLRFASANDGRVYCGGEWLDLRVQENAQKVGQILVDENYRSLTSRYSRPNEPHTFQHNFLAFRPIMDAVEVVKLCHCYNYQACETDDYYETPAHQIVSAIQDCAIRVLPGYDKAEWCI